jgi:hypothetical protein
MLSTVLFWVAEDLNPALAEECRFGFVTALPNRSARLRIRWARAPIRHF